MNVAVIAGATGAVASRLVEHLDASGWEVVGLCRRPAAAHGRVRYLGVDLQDGPAVAKALQGVPKATHVFYSARAKFGEGGVESVEDNVAMLRNVLDAAEASCPGLAHVHLVEGGKWYGQHLGAYPTPAKEDDERHMPPNFYYDQEDLLRGRQQGKRWAGRRRAPTSSATSRRGARATSSRSSAPMPPSAVSWACGWIFRAIRTSSAR